MSRALTAATRALYTRRGLATAIDSHLGLRSTLLEDVDPSAPVKELPAFMVSRVRGFLPREVREMALPCRDMLTHFRAGPNQQVCLSRLHH